MDTYKCVHIGIAHLHEGEEHIPPQTTGCILTLGGTSKATVRPPTTGVVGPTMSFPSLALFLLKMIHTRHHLLVGAGHARPVMPVDLDAQETGVIGARLWAADEGHLHHHR